MKLLIAPFPLLFTICFLTFACSQSENKNVNSAVSNINAPSPSATVRPSSEKQKAFSPDGVVFEPLTSDSNYFDVVKWLGTPDAEMDVAKDQLPFPTMLACYKQNACVLFTNIDNFQQKGLKSNYKYVGAIKMQPPEILHSADPKNLDLLEVTRTVVIKKLLNDAEKEVKQKRK